MNIIGLGCKAQVGKDTGAEYLEENYEGVKQVSFADKVKEICMSLYGLTHAQCYGSKKIKESVDFRYNKSARQIMQEVGEKMREVYRDIWIHHVFYTTIPELEKEGYHTFIISDVRYPNEGDWIHDFGGVVIKINRSAGGTSVGADHSSETSMDNYKKFDFVIDNNDTIPAYYAALDVLMEHIESTGRNYDRKETKN